MLINCPECGKQISDQAVSCIHCGYQFKNSNQNQNMYNINGCNYDFTTIITNIHSNDKTPASIIRDISDVCNIPIYEAKEIYFKILNQNELSKNIYCEQKQQPNTPKCPTCGSTNIEKISLTRKAFGGAMFGLFSSDLRNTMHCKNCGYKW